MKLTTRQKPPRKPLKRVFTSKPVIQTCVQCNVVKTRIAEPPPPEIRYFPPRGIDVLPLERATLRKEDADLLEKAKSILAKSPHPAIGVLHKYFSNDKGPDDCEGKENASLACVESLVDHVVESNSWWKDPRWIGPRAMDITIYVAFKYESKNFKGTRKKPHVLDDDDKYKARVNDIKALTDSLNKAYPPPDPLPSKWPTLADADGDKPVCLYFHVVPVLEDEENSTDSERYKSLVDICQSVFEDVANVFFRRNPEDNSGSSPLNYLETHPKNKELKSPLSALSKAQKKYTAAKAKVAALAKLPTSPNIESQKEKAEAQLKSATKSYKKLLGKLPNMLRPSYGYVTGDSTPSTEWWTKENERSMISISEDLANLSKRVVGILLFDGTWQGRSSKVELCMDKRNYKPARVSQWTSAMKLGANRIGSDGQPVRLAATPPPPKK